MIFPRSWFISDTHFDHAGVIEHSRRPFTSVEDMNEQLIKNWNAVVKPTDNVYHLGDFGWKKRAHDIFKQLNGHIHKIRGNHHTAADGIKDKFIWYKDVHEIKIRFIEAAHGACDCDYAGQAGVHYHQCASLSPKIGKQRVWLSHYAHRTWPRMHHGVWHLYGHSHGSLKWSENEGLSMDVGVDAIAELLAFQRYLAAKHDPNLFYPHEPVLPTDYRPISFEEIHEIMKKREFKPVDHHDSPEVGG